MLGGEFFLASSQMIHHLEDWMHLRVNMKAGQVETQWWALETQLKNHCTRCGFFCHNASSLQNNFKSYSGYTLWQKGYQRLKIPSLLFICEKCNHHNHNNSRVTLIHAMNDGNKFIEWRNKTTNPCVAVDVGIMTVCCIQISHWNTKQKLKCMKTNIVAALERFSMNVPHLHSLPCRTSLILISISPQHF